METTRKTLFALSLLFALVSSFIIHVHGEGSPPSYSSSSSFELETGTPSSSGHHYLDQMRKIQAFKASLLQRDSIPSPSPSPAPSLAAPPPVKVSSFIFSNFLFIKSWQYTASGFFFFHL